MPDTQTVDYNNFCNPNDVRDFVRKPFVLNKNLVATTGTTLIFGPIVGNYSMLQDIKNIKNIEDLLIDASKINFYQPANFYLPEKKDCRECKGAGKIYTEKCKECFGEGTAYAQTEYNDYEVDCLTCDGSGETSSKNTSKVCPTCHGKKQIHNSGDYLEIEGTAFQLQFLEKIASFDDLKIHISNDKGMLFFESGAHKGIVIATRANNK